MNVTLHVTEKHHQDMRTDSLQAAFEVIEARRASVAIARRDWERRNIANSWRERLRRFRVRFSRQTVKGTV